jgi:hypothetical protein
MTLHTLNVKGLEQPHRQPQRQTTPRQTTRKGRTGGTDGRQFSLTPTVKAAPFAALRTHPVITCERHSVAQSDCAASRQPRLAKYTSPRLREGEERRRASSAHRQERGGARMRTTHKGGGECLAMTSRRRPPRDMRGRGVSYHMGRGSLLLPSSSLCWPRSKRVVDRAQICCCLPSDLKPEMGPRQQNPVSQR